VICQKRLAGSPLRKRQDFRRTDGFRAENIMVQKQGSSDMASITDAVNVGAGRAGWKLSDAPGTGIEICQLVIRITATN
tara:strand:- start:292 stop:528 length:237 start_codon:yes stop_codon:yes gene_type:complete